MQQCILKLVFDNSLYDEITDSLLTFPDKELEFMGYLVQAHTKTLGDIREQVSGFKQNMVIEITTHEEEAVKIIRYIKDVLADAPFDYQLLPLLNFSVS
ncbi:MAG: DUF3240 family protein [Gammaproteobacteria bacterium]|nr:DUF3240 family protein [Gammaproteobacteria bacterium]